MRPWNSSALSLVASGALGVGCQAPAEKGDVQPPTPLEVSLPDSFPELVVPEDNPTTVQGVALGRTLYYDRRTSPDRSRACADCHLQAYSFGNPEVLGILPHVNLGWASNFLWAGGYAGTLEDVMYLELVDFFESDVTQLREPDLEGMFLQAFGSTEVTLEKAAMAMAQFQRTMVSAGSPFDDHVAGTLNALTESERRGMYLFYYGAKGTCHGCHAGLLFTDNDFHNIGLDDPATLAGTGRATVTGRAEDDGRFKTPTLRNVAITAPYMHDDRFATLAEVVEQYSTGIVSSPTLDKRLPAGGYQFTAQEAADIVAFLEALTDPAYLEDPALAAPSPATAD